MYRGVATVNNRCLGPGLFSSQKTRGGGKETCLGGILPEPWEGRGHNERSYWAWSVFSERPVSPS